MGIKHFILIVAMLFALPSQACELTMGYRTNARAPLIAEAPDNQGLYLDLYSAAAQQIGCSLSIMRAPKKRILRGLREGSIDFYPALNFTEDRARYIHYIENGLPGGDIGISHKNLDEVTELHQLKGKRLVKAIGSPNFVEGIAGIQIIEKPELPTAKAIDLIDKERVDFYIYNRDSILYELKLKRPDNIHIHLECCGGTKPLYLGFSKYSPHFKGKANPSFKSERASAIHQADLLENSIALQFARALADMKESFKTKAIYAFYYD